MQMAPKTWLTGVSTEIKRWPEPERKKALQQLIQLSQAEYAKEPDADNGIGDKFQWKHEAEVAAHEAAHAVAAVSLGWNLTSVFLTKREDGPTRGRYNMERPAAEIAPENIPSDQLTEYRIKHIIVTLAGPATNLSLFNDGSFAKDALRGSDAKQAFEIAEKETGKVEKIHEILGQCFVKASRFVFRRRIIILELADELIRLREMKGPRLTKWMSEKKIGVDPSWLERFAVGGDSARKSEGSF
jgi:hypothetical protein